MTNINIPVSKNLDPAGPTKVYFDTYGQRVLTFGANEVEQSIAFFTSKGFSNEAATATAMVILDQAKKEGKPVFKILDTLKDFNGLQISSVVAKILNKNRKPISTLGYTSGLTPPENVRRNIRA
jgi:hypothetical protein